MQGCTGILDGRYRNRTMKKLYMTHEGENGTETI